MKIRTRMVLGFGLVAVAGFAATWRWVEDDVVPHYNQSMEESLVDIAQLLAAWLSNECDNGRIDAADMKAAFEAAQARSFEAKIYEVVKRAINLRVYVTDAAGIVVFDSGGEYAGRDFSQWRDVFLTLRGKYGARATRLDPEDPLSTVLHVAAPVICKGELAGVLTAAKPVSGVAQFIEKSRQEIATAAAAVLLLTAGIGTVMAAWLTRPIDRLTRYVRAVKAGKRVPPPAPGNSELSELAFALEEMRDAIEGRRYAERYVQSLTHGLKSPLSGIRAASELLEEDMDPVQRARFLGDIQVEVGRLDRIVDRLLLLASVEHRKGLDGAGEFDFAETVGQLRGTFVVAAEKQGVTLEFDAAGPARLLGDEFLCEQAAANLVQNALDFTPAGGRVDVSVRCEGDSCRLVVEDTGPGVPEYALGRVFERFFSMPRPGTGRKSSGLGLSFVKEVAELHGGRVSIENRPGGGTRACLELARRPPVV